MRRKDIYFINYNKKILKHFILIMKHMKKCFAMKNFVFETCADS